MKVSKRQRQIIEMLLERKNEMTAADIAQALQLSARTILRELPEIEAILSGSGVSLLKKAGTGIQIYAPPKDIDHLRKQLLVADSAEYSPDERKVLVICRLLESDEPIKLFSLSHDMQVAIPTISSDLDELQSWIERQGLILVRRRGYGVELIGPESAKRNVIGQLVSEHLADSVLFGSDSELVSDPVSRQLLKMVGHEQFFRIEKVLWQLDKQEQTTLSEGEYTELLIRLSIALTRCRQQMHIDEADAPAADGSATDEDRARYRYFCDALQLSLPEAEAAYLVDLLRNWRKRADNPGLLVEDLKLRDDMARLIQAVGEQLGIPFEQDRSLQEGLMQHMERVIHRLRDGEPIRNPLLAQIRKDYEQLFAAIRLASAIIIDHLMLPDEEIAYLVMHFGAAIERITQQALRVRALLVCTSGIGSSKLLAVRLQKELPQIEQIAHVSWFEASRFEKEAYDLIISTVDLPLPAEQYVRASPLLTQEEVARLRQFIQELPVKTRAARDYEQEPQKPSFTLLADIRQYSQQIVPIIERFHIYTVPDAANGSFTDLHAIVAYMTRILTERQLITSSDDIAARIVAREQHGSQLINGTELALFHTRSESVDAPSLSLFRFEQPVAWPGTGNQPVRQILFMLGPLELDRQSLEVLSEFSVMLLEPSVIKRLSSDDEASIKQFYSERFEQFIKTKLEWRE